MTFHILGMSSSQLTLFFRGVAQPPTSVVCACLRCSLDHTGSLSYDDWVSQHPKDNLMWHIVADILYDTVCTTGKRWQILVDSASRMRIVTEGSRPAFVCDARQPTISRQLLNTPSYGFDHIRQIIIKDTVGNLLRLVLQLQACSIVHIAFHIVPIAHIFSSPRCFPTCFPILFS